MSVPAYTIQHDKAIWGDPENFRPERWLEENDLSRYLMTFGKGPRQCVRYLPSLPLLTHRNLTSSVFLPAINRSAASKLFTGLVSTDRF